MPVDGYLWAIEAAAAAIAENETLLTELDSAIGDGDHGLNMRRGFDAILASRDEILALEPGAALQKAGMTLVTKVGGASGPLYGSLLMGMGKAAGSEARIDESLMVKMVEEGVAMVKRRGRSDVGEKTMLDVLVPVSRALREGVEDGLSTSALAARLAAVAADGLEATREMRATKGRASYLGERSVGHLDPGAMSSCLLVKSLCAHFGEPA